MTSKISIVPVWPVKKEYLKFAQNVIHQVFGLDSFINNRNIYAKDVCDPFRDQYLASSILVKLNEQGKTVIMVTHESDLAEYATSRLHMRDGLIDRIEESSA